MAEQDNREQLLTRLRSLHDRINHTLPEDEAKLIAEANSVAWPAWTQWGKGPPWKNGPQ